MFNSKFSKLRKFAFATACVAVLIHAASAAPLKKVSIAVGSQVLNVTYPWLLMPKVLGYWQSMGYDVDIVGLSGSTQALQQMAAGGVQFAQLNSTDLVRANSDRKLPVRAVMNTGVIDWGLAVLANGPIKSVAQLKGKRIGIVSLATGGLPLMQSLLAENGLDPQHDVEVIATGAGAPALDALKSGRVQALMFWQTAITGFENSGASLRVFRDPSWQKLPDFTLTTMATTVNTTPETVIAIAKGAAMAIEFTNANPECVRKLQWKYFPSTKPTGVDEATAARWDDALLKSQLASMNSAFVMNGAKYIGATDPAGIDRMQQFMVRQKLVGSVVTPTDMVVDIPNFVARVNDFDHEAIKAAARKCAF